MEGKKVKVTQTNLSVGKFGVTKVVTGTIIGDVEIVATSICRTKYNIGNPIGTVRIWMN